MVTDSPGVPAPEVADDLLVAAVLSRRPFGVRSVRSVARFAGLTPAAAAVALRSLEEIGVAVRRRDQVAAERACTLTVWTIDWRAPAWHAMAGAVGAVQLPDTRPQRRARRLPARLAHLFWSGDNLDAVDPHRHGHMVASRILRSDDCQALGWLAAHLAPSAILAATEGRGLDSRRAGLGRLLATAR